MDQGQPHLSRYPLSDLAGAFQNTQWEPHLSTHLETGPLSVDLIMDLELDNYLRWSPTD